jgi:HEAT repeat protein
MAETLGRLGSDKAVPVLIKAMEQTREKQPVRVHREAAEALGRIGDPAAVDALLTVTFRVPDAPTTTSIGERSKLALVRIGEPAVPKVVQMLRGEHDEVERGHRRFRVLLLAPPDDSSTSALKPSTETSLSDCAT